MDGHTGQTGHEAERDITEAIGETDATSGCATCWPLLETFYHHALGPEQARTVADHAAGCARCGAALARFAATDRMIADAPVALPGPELRQRLATRIAAARASRSVGMTASSVSNEREAVVSDANHMNDTTDTNDMSGMTGGHDSQWRATGIHTTRGGRRWQRLRVWMGTAAALLIVGLLASVFLMRAQGTMRQPQVGTGSSPTSQSQTAPSAQSGACAPGKISAHLPAHTYLYDLAMVSPNEGWAVGVIQDAQDNGPSNSLILHFHNCAWTPVASNYPNTPLTSISMVSATDGWIVGGSGGDVSTPLALHFTGGRWQQVTVPAGSGASGMYSQVRMRSADEGWIVVSYHKDAHGYGSQGLLHFAHGQWSQVTAPFGMVNDVLPVAPDDAWVAGLVSDQQQTPVLYHYHAGSWTAATTPNGVVIDQLRMVAPNNIWASGHINASTNWDVDQSSAVLHYDGANWALVKTGSARSAQIIQAFDAGAAWAITLRNTKVAGGFGYIISGVQYGGGDAWQTVKWPFNDLYSVGPLARVSSGAYWAIGRYEVTVPNVNGNGLAGHAVPVLLYFANGAWHEYGR